MKSETNPRARLMVELPADRYRFLTSVDRVPRVGDMLVLDQGYTDSDGQPMVLAYFPGFGKESLYEANVYESELK